MIPMPVDVIRSVAITRSVMPRLCLAVLVLSLLLAGNAASAAETPVQGGSSLSACIATLTGARLGAVEGFCYETIVANTSEAIREDSRALPLVIGLHWSGSRPAEFREVLAGIRHPVRLVLLQGGNPRRKGFSFYPVDPYYYDMDASSQRAVQRDESDRLAAFATQVSGTFQACGRPAVIGASQGGDLAYLLGLRHPDKVGLAIPLMATIDPALIPERAAQKTAIHVMHGITDPIVPIGTARSLAQAARANGFEVSLTQFADTGHDVPEAMRARVAALVDAYLQGLQCAR